MGVLAKLNKCNGPDKRFKLVPSAYSLDRNHLEAQTNNIMLGEQAEVKNKTHFFGLLTSCLV